MSPMADLYRFGDRVEFYLSSLSEDLTALGLVNLASDDRGKWLRGTVCGTSSAARVRVRPDDPLDDERLMVPIEHVRPIAAVDLLGELTDG